MKSEDTVTVRGRYLSADTRTLCQLLEAGKVAYGHEEASQLSLTHNKRTFIGDLTTLVQYLVKEICPNSGLLMDEDQCKRLTYCQAQVKRNCEHLMTLALSKGAARQDIEDELFILKTFVAKNLGNQGPSAVSDYAIYNQIYGATKVVPEAANVLDDAAEKWLNTFGQKSEVK